MKMTIEDIHNSHGSVFTIALKTKDKRNAKAMKTLTNLLQPFIRGKTADESALYIYGIEISPDGNECKLKLAESVKVLAQVDYRWNLHRADKKFVVLVLDGEGDDWECPKKQGGTA